MVTQTRVHLQTLVILIFHVHLSQPVCVDVPSATEAVLGKSMKLTCISCLKREEIKAKTRVDWYYMPNKENDMPIDRTHIYKYDDEVPQEVDGPFKGRLRWDGSQDLQDVSIQIKNVTLNDSGVYECHVYREFEFDFYTPSVFLIKDIKLKVKERATQDPTALYSEIMMYVLLVFLTLWLLVEMVYCYRKISRSDEQVQDTATNYLAIPSVQKANPAVPVTE
ncbi:sodium channel subunit beta-3 isoform X1 [Labrus mixtus]|uniref:sodium channel subunit beta-3 isoform X1 n=2 Tax=Labrus mixtus TaxID=508554 RepID=UPI0029BFFCFE|nr:sodium channel subunit beta-3 isoform X1 [Labrus mixtus]XP_060902581.1 sodium channel subunit beta-3 isoform X1 [Labrus mixtus]XP_060902582.1 sodium channel subunit beta-3 isoform X1 [Labrus mixtus]XP_060902583.1 sodium channel subunit beta-3 isoform X1 [Labrus mixtus]